VKSLKAELLRELDDQLKMKKAMLLTPFEAAQITMGPGRKLKGPRKILAKLLRRLRAKGKA
jgi:hypothetical protein